MQNQNQTYLSVKSSQMEVGKIYYHYSSRFNNSKWVRLVDYLGDSDHMSVITSDYFTYISDNDLVQRYASMKWNDRLEFHSMLNDDTAHPYSVIAELFGIEVSDVSNFSYLSFSQPRKEFYDSNILLEVLDIEDFPFKRITVPKLSDYNWKKNWVPLRLNKDGIRDIKLNQILG